MQQPIPMDSLPIGVSTMQKYVGFMSVYTGNSSFTHDGVWIWHTETRDMETTDTGPQYHFNIQYRKLHE